MTVSRLIFSGQYILLTAVPDKLSARRYSTYDMRSCHRSNSGFSEIKKEKTQR